MFRRYVQRVLGQRLGPLLGACAVSLPLWCAGVAHASVASYYFTHVYTPSTNWAGYVVEARGGYTEVSGSWKVSSAKCTGPATDSGTWIGLGGFDGADRLEQVGTDTSCTASTAQFGPGVAYSEPFVQVVPAPQQEPSRVVDPGDHLTRRDQPAPPEPQPPV